MNEHKLLTVNEAAKYYHIGRNTIRRLSDKKDCPFVLWVGNKRMIKCEQFDEFLKNAYSI